MPKLKPGRMWVAQREEGPWHIEKASPWGSTAGGCGDQHTKWAYKADKPPVGARRCLRCLRSYIPDKGTLIGRNLGFLRVPTYDELREREAVRQRNREEGGE